MKLFKPVTPENKIYTYDALVYKASFGTNCLKVKETGYAQLRRVAENALIRKDDEEALQYAGKMAIEYGVGGLFFYIDTYTRILSERLKDNEVVEAEAVKLLGYLYFAQQMVLEKKDSKALRSMEQFAPDYEVNFWTVREKECMTLLVNAPFALQESRDMANILIDECCTKKPVP